MLINIMRKIIYYTETLTYSKIISANNNGPPQKVGKSVMLHGMYFICAVNLQNIISTQNCVLSIRISSIETACFG